MAPPHDTTRTSGTSDDLLSRDIPSDNRVPEPVLSSYLAAVAERDVSRSWPPDVTDFVSSGPAAELEPGPSENLLLYEYDTVELDALAMAHMVSVEDRVPVAVSTHVQ